MCVYVCNVCVCVTFFSCCFLNRQSLRYSLQNSTHAILISHQNMGARAPTLSLTPNIIDIARLQISFGEDERHRETKQWRERERELDMWGRRERDRERKRRHPHMILSPKRYSRFRSSALCITVKAAELKQ